MRGSAEYLPLDAIHTSFRDSSLGVTSWLRWRSPARARRSDERNGAGGRERGPAGCSLKHGNTERGIDEIGARMLPLAGRRLESWKMMGRSTPEALCGSAGLEA